MPQTAYCVDGRVSALPAAKPSLWRQIRGRTDTGDFVKRVHRAVRAEKLETQVWLPCPTLSRFEFPIAASGKLITGNADPTQPPFSCRVP